MMLWTKNKTILTSAVSLVRLSNGRFDVHVNIFHDVLYLAGQLLTVDSQHNTHKTLDKVCFIVVAGLAWLHSHAQKGVIPKDVSPQGQMGLSDPRSWVVCGSIDAFTRLRRPNNQYLHHSNDTNNICFSCK